MEMTVAHLWLARPQTDAVLEHANETRYYPLSEKITSIYWPDANDRAMQDWKTVEFQSAIRTHLSQVLLGLGKS